MQSSVLGSLAIIVVSVSVSALGAQVAQRPRGTPSAVSVPNFSGTWVVVSPEDEADQVKEVAQTATTLTIGGGSEADERKMVYRLGGLGVREETRIQRKTVVTVSTAKFEGKTLVIAKDTTLPDGRTQISKQVWSLDANGRLVIVFTQSIGGEQLQSRTFVHRKDK